MVRVANMPSSPNALELAILEAMARERPSAGIDVNRLAVRRRKYTGVGCYTDFLCDGAGERGTFLIEHRVGAVPVLSPGTLGLVGIVSYVDVLRAARSGE